MFAKLKSWTTTEFNQNKVALTEDQVLLLNSSKLSFYGAFILKLALNHVPGTNSATLRGTSTPICYSSVAATMNKKSFSILPSDVKNSAEVSEHFCKKFLSSALKLQDVSWEHTAEGEIYCSTCWILFKVWRVPYNAQPTLQCCCVWIYRSIAC